MCTLFKGKTVCMCRSVFEKFVFIAHIHAAQNRISFERRRHGTTDNLVSKSAFSNTRTQIEPARLNAIEWLIGSRTETANANAKERSRKRVSCVRIRSQMFYGQSLLCICVCVILCAVYLFISVSHSPPNILLSFSFFATNSSFGVLLVCGSLIIS